MAAVMAATTPSCSWANPGANPYRGDPVAAVDDFALSVETRRKLKAMMAAHAYTDVVAIGRDGIQGASGYDDLRDMHSGHGQTCHGPVDRSAWSVTRQERGLVYCVDGEDTCVIVPTICNNVSLVSKRKPQADEPIDIEPAAGPAAVGADPGGGAPTTFADALAAPAGLSSDRATSSGSSATMPTQTWSPIVSGPGIGGGGTRPSTPVPEPPSWTLTLVGLAAMMGLGASRARRRQRPQATKSGFSKPGLP